MLRKTKTVRQFHSELVLQGIHGDDIWPNTQAGNSCYISVTIIKIRKPNQPLEHGKGQIHKLELSAS